MDSRTGRLSLFDLTVLITGLLETFLLPNRNKYGTYMAIVWVESSVSWEKSGDVGVVKSLVGVGFLLLLLNFLGRCLKGK